MRLNEVRASIMNQGVLPANRFELIIPRPRAVAVPSQLMALRCNSVKMPEEYSLGVYETMGRLGFGQMFRIPYIANPSRGDLTVEAIDTKDGQVISAMYTWLNSVVETRSSGGDALQGPRGDAGGAFAYEVGFFDDYTTNITLRVFSEDGNKAFEIIFYRACITGISGLSLDWNRQEDVIRHMLQFTYVNSTLIGSRR